MIRSIGKYILFLGLGLGLTGFFNEAAAQDKTISKQATTSKKSSSKSAKSKKTSSSVTKSPEEMEKNVLKVIDAFRKKQYGAALVYCEDTIHSIPDDAPTNIKYDVRMMCLDLYTKNGRNEDALKLTEEMRKLPLTEEMQNSLCFSEATTLTRLHRWTDAEEKYKGCGGNDIAGQAVIASNVAELYMIRGDAATAVEKYNEAIRLNANNPHALYGLSVAWSRVPDMKQAERAFLKGLAIDPAFLYLKDAFFEPEYDQDYETAVRMSLLNRDLEAKFHLEKYLKNETRLPYREAASDLLNTINTRITDSKSVIISSYPVLLGKISKVAIDDSGRWLAVANIEKADDDGFSLGVWTVDLSTGKTVKRLTLNDDLVMDLSFVAGSSELHVLNKKLRYVIEASDPRDQYFYYDNVPDFHPISLANGGTEIVYLTADSYISYSAWNDPYKRRVVGSVPMETMRVGLSHEHDWMMVATPRQNYIVNVPAEKAMTLQGNFRLSSVVVPHPKYNIFALGIQSGVLFADENGSYTVVGSVNSVPVSVLGFSPGGHLLAVCTDMNVEILDVDRIISHIQTP